MVNRRGFTLVEVLAVVIILSVLSIMVIPNVSEYVAQGKDEYNKSLKKTLTLAGKNFYSDNKVRIPKPVGVVTDFVTANELSSQNYLTGSFVDSDKNDCKSKSYVVAVNEISDVKYHACLTCGDKNYSSDDEYCDAMVRDIDSSNPSDSGKSKVTCNVSAKDTDDGASVTINANSSKEKINKIIYYNTDTKKYTSLLTDSEYSTFIKKTITISDFGKFKIYVSSSDGVRSDCDGSVIDNSFSANFKVDMYLVNKSEYDSHKNTEYTKTELNKLDKYDGTTWKNAYVYAKLTYKKSRFSSVKFDGNDLNNKFIWLDAEGAKNYKITAVDKRKGTQTVSLSTKLDRSPPTVVFSRTPGDGWTNQAVTVTSTPSDAFSGIEGLYYSTNNEDWSKVSYSGSFVKVWERTNTSKTMYVKAKDNVGLYSDVKSSNILIDVVPPVMYKHCLYKVASKKWYFRYYFSDSGGSGYSGYKWGYCYRICPKCPSSYMCSYKSADTKAASGSWHSSSYKETSYQIAPTRGARTIGSTTRLYFRDNAGNVATDSYTDTWYYGGGSSPGSC